MQETSAASAEPSMEEILASIRKIISEDAPANNEADVVELTQMVQDDGSVADLKKEAPMPVETKPIEPFMPSAPPPPVQPAESLVSSSAASAASNSLSALASTIEIERLSSAPIYGTPLGNGARTLEDMVIEVIRPLLKQWLDQNLPATVDRLVQKEIERIARKS